MRERERVNPEDVRNMQKWTSKQNLERENG